MTQKFLKTVFIFLLLFLSLTGSGEDPQNPRLYDEVEMAAYLEADEFAYMEFKVRPPSIWDRIGWWIGSIFTTLFSNSNAPWLSKFIFYGLMFLVLGVAIFYILKLRYGGGVSRESRKYSGVNVQSVQSGTPEDFDRLIQESITAKNFKMAIRYLYLKSLSFLSEKQLVKLKDWKSPYDYEKELTHELIPYYRDLSQLFEYAWYGDFNVGESDFNKGSDLLSKLKGEVE